MRWRPPRGRVAVVLLLLLALVAAACGGGDDPAGGEADAADAASDTESGDDGGDDETTADAGGGSTDDPDDVVEIPEGPKATLTGLPADEALADTAAVVVKISNNDDRSLAALIGIEHADIVIEERIEDRATRFAAIYHSELPALVGPVRSARTTDLDLMRNLGTPILIFSGANIAVLGELRDLALDEGVVLVVNDDSETYHYRDLEFAAPDNLFTDVELVVADKGEAAGGAASGSSKQAQQAEAMEAIRMARQAEIEAERAVEALRAQLVKVECPVSAAGARVLHAAGLGVRDLHDMDEAAARRLGLSAEDARLVGALTENCPYPGAPFGEGGVLHAIGTDHGTKAWSNPHTDGKVVAAMSSVGSSGLSSMMKSRA